MPPVITSIGTPASSASAMPLAAWVSPGRRHDGQRADRAGDAAHRVGDEGGAALVGDEHRRDLLRLVQLVVELGVLHPGDAEGDFTPSCSRACTASQAAVFFIALFLSIVRRCGRRGCSRRGSCLRARAGRACRRRRSRPPRPPRTGRDRRPAASSTRHCRSVWMPPRLLRLMMNSRIAISGPPCGRGSSGTCRCAGDRPSSGAHRRCAQLLVVVEGLAARDLRVVAADRGAAAAPGHRVVALQRVHLCHQRRQVAAGDDVLAAMRQFVDQPAVAEQQVAQEGQLLLVADRGIVLGAGDGQFLDGDPCSSSARNTAARWRRPAPPGRACRSRSPAASGRCARPLPVQPQRRARRHDREAVVRLARLRRMRGCRRRSSTSCRGG
jgi:hypothetical protein